MTGPAHEPVGGIKDHVWKWVRDLIDARLSQRRSLFVSLYRCRCGLWLRVEGRRIGGDVVERHESVTLEEPTS